jgi:hypothetical protein
MLNCRTEKKVLIHNSSPLSKESMALWLVYDEMVKVRNGHQVRGVTPVTPVTVSSDQLCSLWMLEEWVCCRSR